MKQGVRDARVGLVADAAYLTEVRHLVAGAEARCWCSLFIVEPVSNADRDVVIDTLLVELASSRWRGVDTRLIIGGSRENLAIMTTCMTAQRRADRLGIPARLLAATDVRGSHVKLVLSDERALLGSHNWSFGAMTDQTQDSVVVDSPALAARLATYFAHQWDRADQVSNRA